MRRLVQKTMVTALGLALATVPLTGCFGFGGGGEDSSDDTTEVTVDDTLDYNEFDQKRTPTGNPDYTTWTTLGDAFDAAEDIKSSGCDTNYYLGVMVVEDRDIYVVGGMTPDLYDAYNEAEDSAAEEKALASATIMFKEDITDKCLPESELNTLWVGKTGQDLVNAGYAFQGYTMTGENPETAATYDNGFYGYEFTFGISTPDSATEDEGASLLTAPITAVASYGNISDIAMNPTTFALLPELTAAGFVPSPSESATAEIPAGDATAVAPADSTLADGTATSESVTTTETPVA